MRRLYSLLLYLYPPAFRRTYGREMLRFASELTSSGTTRRAVWQLAVDLARTVPREWRDELGTHVIQRRTPRRERPGAFMQTLIADVRFAFRLFRRTPLFTAAALLTLALGIGANTAMFTLADATVLRPLQVTAPEELRVWSWASSNPDYRAYAERTDVFQSVAAISNSRLNLAIDGEATLESAALVSGNFFSVLGVPAAVGRPLQPSDDDGPGAPVNGVLAHHFWRTRLGSDPAVIGKVLRANGTPITIVGVAAQGFRGVSLSSAPVLYLPVSSVTQVSTGFLARRQALEYSGLVWLTAIARLRPDVTEGVAIEEMNALYRRLHPPPPGSVDVERLRLVPLVTRALGGDSAASLQRFVLLLLGVVGLTLLIGCANLASLLLARAAARRREMAVRLALGASRGRVVRQMLVEHLMLAIAGGALGVYVAHLAIGLLASYQLPGGVRIDNLGLAVNGLALAGAAALSIATGLLVGTAPAWRAARADLLPALGDGARGTRGLAGARSALVAAQVALSLVLLAGTGLFLRSLMRALDVPLGFDPSGVATASVNAGLARYDNSRAWTYYEDALARVRALPGVTAAAWTNLLPTRGVMIGQAEDVAGYIPRPGEVVEFETPHVGADYFRVARIRVVSGRGFEADDLRGPGMVVVNRAAAEKYWPGRDPIGGLVRWSKKTQPMTVIGVVENTAAGGLGTPAPPTAYLQFGRTTGGFVTLVEPAHLLVRTSGNVAAILPLVREQLRGIDPGVPIYGLEPLAAYVSDLVLPQRMGVTLFALFSLLASTLAAVGIYGVSAYVAALRQREIGVRIALGADRRHIRTLVLVEGGKPVAAGMVVGLGLALWSARLTSGFMYEVEPTDPITFAAVTAVLATIGFLASYVPARRAARMDPAQALRAE